MSAIGHVAELRTWWRQLVELGVVRAKEAIHG